jgi:uncharacterized protein YkwD
MVVIEDPKQTLRLARQTSLGWATASVILSIFLAGQPVVVLRAADTPSPSKASSRSPAAVDASAVSTGSESVLTEGTAQLERRMWELINLERESSSHRPETRGRSRPLKWDARLAEIARAHSREMAERAYFSHFSSDGTCLASRVSEGGISYLAAAENIARFRDVLRAQAAFMNEPPLEHNHRANILDPDYTHLGVGIVRGPDGMFYITQDFVQRP